ncbi:MAG: beta-galactosidase [Clostridia bacterium]|nr:beta-galactosidase [Clostridia bacterium]
MMKRVLSVILSLTLLAAGLCACTPGEKPTDTTAEDTAAGTVTAPSAETPTDASTEAPTEEPTEAPTEEVTRDPAEVEAEKQAAMKEIYDSTPMNQLPIGGWSTPASALRDGYTGTEGSYDAVWRLLADAGLNYMITLEEWSSGSWPLESLSSARKAGMKLWYNCAGMAADYNAEKLRALLDSPDADALGAIYVKDEPSFDQIGETAELMTAARRELGDTSLPVLANLLPTYANSSWVGGNYRKYVSTYLETAKPDILMFDYYPYPKSGDSLPNLAANLAIVGEEAKAAGVPFYAYVQTSADTAYREPTVEELSLNTHLALAMGAKGIAYFLVCEHYEGWEYSSMITAKGEKTPLFDTVQTVNGRLNAMKGVYLDYDCKGVIICNYRDMSNALSKARCTSELESYRYLSAAETNQRDKFAIGCFENAAGEVGYYIVNLNYKGAGTIHLTFDGEMDYRIWSGEGLTDMGTAETLKLKPEAGEGVFLQVSPAEKNP